MKTKHVIACVWQINTECKSKQVAAIGLRGLDALGRFQLLAKTVKLAYEAMWRIKALEPLFVFAAPEFYFSSEEDHFYDEDTKEHLRTALIGLSNSYPNLLLIPGTIAWAKTSVPSDLRAKRKIKERGSVSKRDLSKYAPPYATKLQSVDKFSKWSMEDQQSYRSGQLESFGKRLMESDPELKIARNTALVLYGGRIWHKYNKRFEMVVDELSLDVPGNADYKNTVFPPSSTSPIVPSIDGVKIGIEICADHEHASLKTLYGWNCHLHIICSAHVSIYKEHAAVRKDGGYIVQADSINSGVYRKGDLHSGNDMADPDQNLELREVDVPVGKVFLAFLPVEVETAQDQYFL